VIPVELDRRAACRDIADATYRRELADCPPALRRHLLRECVREAVTVLLNLSANDQARLDDDRPLTEYGVDSLGVLRLRNRLSKRLNRPLAATLVVEYPTVTSLTEHLAAQPWPADDARSGEASAADHDQATDVPLSMQQERWLRLVAAGYGKRVVPIVFGTRLVRPAFRRALADVLTTHELLRFRYPDGRIELLDVDQVVPDDEDLFRDLSELDPPGAKRALAEQVEQCRAAMPDPARHPSWRVRCLDWPGNRFLLLLSLQHLDFDGSSITTFVEDLRTAYRARLLGRTPVLRDVPGYAEYVRWQRAYRARAIGEDRAFFQGLYLALDKPTILDGHHGLAQTRPLLARRYTSPRVPGLWCRTRDRAGAMGVTPFSVLLAAYGRLIGGITGQSAAVIAMITNGRPAERFQHTIGPFTAPFPVPVPAAGSPLAAARACHRIVASINARSHYPVADLTGHVPAFSGLPADTYFTDAGINFTSYRREDNDAWPRVRVIEILGPVEDQEFAAAESKELLRIPGLHLVIDLVDDELRLNFWYHAERFSQEQVAQWADRYETLVDADPH
jgi:aryl carrier-like protein